MHRRRFSMMALGLALGSVGCRAGSGTGGLNPSPSTAPKSVDQQVATEVVDQINANALKVQSLKAKTEVSLSAKWQRGAVHGLMAVQTPRDFRLQLEAMGSRPVADLGSNPGGFWFWTQSKDSMQYPVGTYDAQGNPPPNVPLTYQPDWIVEALGLREISAEDAAAMKVTRLDAGTLKLTLRRRSAAGESYSKVLIVDEATKQVREQQLLGPDQRLIASARVLGPYQSIRLPAVDGEVTADTVKLPRKLKLELVEPDKLILMVDLQDVSLNESLDPGLFVEPDKRAEGYTRMDVGAGRPAVASAPRSRQTRPSPSVRLGDPIAVPEDLPVLPEGVVGPREPMAPRSLSPSSAVRAASFEGGN